MASDTDTALTFHERGSWHIHHNQNMSFSNTYRWTLDRTAGMISLEHLRMGPNNPVFLFHLVPTGNHLLASVDSHHCEQDVYLSPSRLGLGEHSPLLAGHRAPKK